MPVSHDTLAMLMSAGLAGDDLLRVVASIDADNQPKVRSSNAERQARYRDKKRQEGVTDNATNNVSESVTEALQPRAHVEVKQTNKQTKKQDTDDFVAELSDVLDADRVQALVDVRGKKGGKVNGHAARLLKAKILASGLCPSDAADTMALRNWISIEPSWLTGRTQQSTAPPKKVTVASMWRDEGRKLGILPDEHPHEINGRLDASFGDRPAPGSNFARRIAGAGSG